MHHLADQHFLAVQGLERNGVLAKRAFQRLPFLVNYLNLWMGQRNLHKNIF